MVKDKGFKILLGIYILAFIVDIISTLLNRGLIKYLESNPIYGLTGGWIGIALVILINIVLIFLLYYWYTRTDSFQWRFYICLILASVITTRVLVIVNNINIFLNPPTIEAARQVTTEMKRQAISRLVWLNLLPFLNGAIAWMFFYKDHIFWRKK